MATILSIDDDSELQELMGVLLKGHGHTVESAFSGEEGYEKARSLKPDLILLDLMLPTLNGLEVLKLLKADEALRSVPVIVTTAFSGEAPFNESGAKAAGAAEFLRKPVPNDLMTGTVDSLLKPAR